MTSGIWHAKAGVTNNLQKQVRAALPASAASSREMPPVSDLIIERVAPEETYKTKAYTALKQAITNMDIYSSSEPAWLDERQLSERLGVSRGPKTRQMMTTATRTKGMLT